MIVITGASDGLGKELARLLVRDGKRVINLSRHDSSTASENISIDLTDEPSIKAAVQTLQGMDDPLEALINCAGVLSMQELGAITASELDRVLDTNVKGAMLLVSLLSDRIKKDRTDIVNVASTVGTKGNKNEGAYGVSKWAMRGFSAYLQAEFKDLPNRVTSFCPGGFQSKLFEKATGVDATKNGQTWMRTEDVALCLKQIMDLPKNMEVTEIILNRKHI